MSRKQTPVRACTKKLLNNHDAATNDASQEQSIRSGHGEGLVGAFGFSRRKLAIADLVSRTSTLSELCIVQGPNLGALHQASSC